MREELLSVAVTGAGYWGKHLVRSFAPAQRCVLKCACDTKAAAVRREVTASCAHIISLLRRYIVIPKIPGGEPLALERAHFIKSVLDHRPVRSDGADGLRIVQMLEAGQKSLKNQGTPVSPQAS
jgi:predicted dehydrogenase